MSPDESSNQINTTVTQELKLVGITSYSLQKQTAKRLATIMRPGEHVEAAMAGRSTSGSALLVATDKRLLYVEANLFFHSYDELSYGIVTGIQRNPCILFENITLYTRIHEYQLTHVNTASASRFVKLIENRVSGVGELSHDVDISYQDEVKTNQIEFTDDQRAFLKSHQMMVVANASRTGQVHSAAVYYMFEGGKLYMMTKADTRKAHNMQAHKTVAVTIYDQANVETIQLQATSVIESDPVMRELVFKTLGAYAGPSINDLPIAQPEAGGYMIFRLTPIDIDYHKFEKDSH